MDIPGDRMLAGSRVLTNKGVTDKQIKDKTDSVFVAT